MRLTLTHILAFLAIIAIAAPAVAAQCTLYSSSFNYSYTNNGNITNRVTFVLLNKTSSAINVGFSPETLIVLPNETRNFSIVATASSDPGQQLAWFDIRRGTEVIARAAAPFDAFSCAQGAVANATTAPSASRPFWRDAVFYAAVSLFVFVLILGVVLLVFSRGPREGRGQAPPPSAKTSAKPSRAAGTQAPAEPVVEERHRAPVNVDAMLREHDVGARTPWWLWLLIAIAALIVIGVFVWLVVSGMNVTGFHVGAGLNVTNATNLSNATA